MNGNTLADRLDWLLAGIDKHPWGASIGLGRNQVSGISSGVAPKWYAINAIRCAENIEVPWLMEGIGHPYKVYRFDRESDRANMVKSWLTDADVTRTPTLATDGERVVLALTHPSRYQIEPRGKDVSWWDYLALELIPSCETSTLEVVRNNTKSQPRLAVIASSQMDDIEQGLAGTRRLFLSCDAWLKDAEEIPGTHPIFKRRQALSAEKLSSMEREIVSELRAMEPDVREHYLALARSIRKA